jgi:hypothetical protein
MKNEVEVKAKKIYKRELFRKIVKLSFLFLFLISSILYLVLYLAYEGGKFTVSLDRNLLNRKNVYLSESGNLKDKSLKLSAQTIRYMDNISITWLPENIDEGVGPHNGDNYIAYSFYVVNAGKENVHYWYEIDIDDTILNVDEAIRIMIIQNGKKVVYAKKSRETGKPEEGTEQFVSKSVAVLEQRKDFKPKTKDRYTVVVWIEGSDNECKNDLLGGEIKMHMDITEEHVLKNKK